MSSSKPDKFTRKWFLNHLLTSIYGKGSVKIGFEVDDGIVTIYKKRRGIADKCTFESAENTGRPKALLDQLFHFTFVTEEKNVQFDTELGSGFCRKTAVDNAREFFCHYNVYEADSLDAESIYYGLKDYVLPAIFDFGSSSVITEFKTENISSRFNREINRFSNNLHLKAFTAYTDIDQEECYYDTRFFDEKNYSTGTPFSSHLGECNYAIPIFLRQVFGVPQFSCFEIHIPYHPSQSKPLHLTDSFQELVNGYYPISSEQPRFYKDQFPSNGISLIGNPPTLDYVLPSSPIEPRDLDKTVYFLTKLDKSTIESLYDNPETHEELHQAIMRKALDYIRQQNDSLRHIESTWCANAMNAIEQALKRVSMLAEYSEYLLGDTPDEQRRKGILSVFDIPTIEIDRYMTDYSNADEQWGVIFFCLDRAIHSFFSNLGNPANDIPCFIRRNTNENDRLQHVKCIENILTSDVFCRAIETQRETPPATVPILQTDRNPFSFFQERISNLYETIKKNMEQYLDQLR